MALIKAIRRLTAQPEDEVKPLIGYATEEKQAKQRSRLARRALYRRM